MWRHRFVSVRCLTSVYVYRVWYNRMPYWDGIWHVLVNFPFFCYTFIQWVFADATKQNIDCISMWTQLPWNTIIMLANFPRWYILINNIYGSHVVYPAICSYKLMLRKLIDNWHTHFIDIKISISFLYTKITYSCTIGSVSWKKYDIFMFLLANAKYGILSSFKIKTVVMITYPCGNLDLWMNRGPTYSTNRSISPKT